MTKRLFENLAEKWDRHYYKVTDPTPHILTCAFNLREYIELNTFFVKEMIFSLTNPDWFRYNSVYLPNGIKVFIVDSGGSDNTSVWSKGEPIPDQKPFNILINKDGETKPIQ